MRYFLLTFSPLVMLQLDKKFWTRPSDDECRKITLKVKGNEAFRKGLNEFVDSIIHGAPNGFFLPWTLAVMSESARKNASLHLCFDKVSLYFGKKHENNAKIFNNDKSDCCDGYQVITKEPQKDKEGDFFLIRDSEKILCGNRRVIYLEFQFNNGTSEQNRRLKYVLEYKLRCLLTGVPEPPGFTPPGYTPPCSTAGASKISSSYLVSSFLYVSILLK